MSPESPTHAGEISFLACPRTKAGLVFASEFELKSEDGPNTFAVRDGVSNFLASQSWETPNNDRQQHLLKMAREEGYHKAIETVLEDPTYVMDLARAIYLDLLPLDKNARVLEIGASLGQHTRFIASKCKHVEALEVIPEQALFAKLCCVQDGCLNVNVSIGGEDCQLPYKAEVFDIVIMNYVLEWAASGTELPPCKAHENLITECNRVLRPGGVLFISTKNRYNLRLLKGAVDEHVEFRFGNALPRWLMNYLLKYFPPSKNAGYLHSYGKLRLILKQSGFNTIKPLLALPDGRYPRIYTEFTEDELSVLKTDESLTSSNRSTKFLLKYVPNWAKKWVAPSLVFIAEK